jgi:WD40 repeat protein/serine/threonine protein kinase
MAKNDTIPPADDDNKKKGDGTLNIPGSSGLDSGSASVPPPPEPSRQEPAAQEGASQKPSKKGSDSLRIDHTLTDNAGVDKTMITDYGAEGDSVLVNVDGESSSFAGMRSDLTQTINPRQLDESDRREVEEMLKKALGKADSAESATGTQSQGGVESRLVLQSRTLLPARGVDTETADYRLRRVLGEGGMGTVYLAEQMSLERLVAVKVIKSITPQDRTKLEASGKLAAHERQRREQFLSEAVVTGALDHPNIVPIHDVGRTGDNAPFYSMKRVEGTAWREVISKNSVDENLEILLKVADAVAFAHSRGVVHRDIKPENVMLGDFGVVMLMDWGLAVVTPKFPRYGALRQTSSFGGSPAYMAPEMVGRLDRVSPASDIYLLGAALFEIIAGVPPHPRPTSDLTGWETVRKYLEDVVRPNVIAPVKPEQEGELLEIAKKAMATLPDDRYASVQEFQAAIRSYRAHAESISLARRAQEDLDRASSSKDYGDYARAVFGYEEAVDLWNGNANAATGLLEAKLAYAEAASEKQDYDLGLSLLTEDDARHKPLVSKLRREQKSRNARTARLKIAYAATMGLSLLLIVGGLYAGSVILNARNDLSLAQDETKKEIEAADKAREDADKAKKNAAEVVAKANQDVADADVKIADAAKKVTDAESKAKTAEADAKKFDQLAMDAQKLAQQATEAKNKADAAAMQAMSVANEASKKAEVATDLAEEKTKAAETASKLATKEEYVSQIGLARTRIEQNEFEDARRILDRLKGDKESEAMGWEWNWLSRQARQSTGDAPLPAAGSDVTTDLKGDHAIIAMKGGRIQSVDVDENGKPRLVADVKAAAMQNGVVSALSPDGKTIATATAKGDIKLIQANSGDVLGILEGHRANRAIRRLLFLPDGRLISASDDKTVRLWDVARQKQLAEAWHLGPVSDIAATTTPEGLIIAAAVKDLRGGRVSVWKSADETGQLESLGDFMQHRGPVTAVAVASDGQAFASGDIRGRVLLWNRSDLQVNVDQKNRLDLARAVAMSNERNPATSGNQSLTARELSDRPRTNVFALISDGRIPPAHRDQVLRIAFSHDGKSLLTTSADYSAKVWNVADGTLKKTLLGHGGGVLSAAFLGDDDHVVTTGTDRTIRTWQVSAADTAPEFHAAAAAVSKLQAHDDEIWSASFDPSGHRIVTAGRDHSARILEFDPKTATFTSIGELTGDIGRPRTDDRPLIEGARFVAFSMAMRSDGRRLYVGDFEGAVRIWDAERAVEIGEIKGVGLNFAIALSKDGKTLLTGCDAPDAPAQLWTLNEEGLPQGEAIRLKARAGSLTACAISPDGKRAFTSTANGRDISSLLWNTESGQELAQMPELADRVNAVVFSASGEDLFIASDGKAVFQYSVGQKKTVRVFPHKGYVADVDLSEDGRRMLTVSQTFSTDVSKSTLLLWTLPAQGEATSETLEETETVAKSDPTPNDRILSARFEPGSASAISVHCSRDHKLGQVRVWNLSESGPAVANEVLRFPTSIPAADAAVVIDGPMAKAGRLLTLNGDSVFLWDLNTKNHIRSFRQASAVTEAGFSADGKYVATASRSIVIWDAEKRQPLGKVEVPHDGPVYTINWNPAVTDQFATGGPDGKIQTWAFDPKTNAITLQTAIPAGAPVRKVRWSTDGKQLAAACEDGNVRLWNVADLNQAPLVFGDEVNPETQMLCVALSPAGDEILAGGADGIARIWKIKGPAEDRNHPFAQLRGHADAIESVGFLIDPNNPVTGRRYLTASRDRSARLWDVQDVHELSMSDPVRIHEVLALRRHDLGLTSVQMSPDGHILMTAGLDGRVILWPAGAPE